MRLAIGTLITALALTACTAPRRPDGSSGLLHVGDQAPEVVGSLGGKPISLSSKRGSAAIVYFYPKDETPGCTKEACGFRDAFKKFEDAHVTLFGVSRDSEESHRAFAMNHQLPFPLVADEDGKIASAYGVPSTFGMTSRVTFVVGADGKILRVFEHVDPDKHPDEVLSAIPR